MWKKVVFPCHFFFLEFGSTDISPRLTCGTAVPRYFVSTKWWSLATEAVVDGGREDCGFCRQQSSSTEAAVGWRGNDTMALATMASLANSGSGDGSHHPQLFSSG
jgi:hypothetical protein